ncbi:MAG: hypothetical protein B7Z64_00110 [Acidiphilium sp. 21-68-69]|nr:MAG: hypothetical protein B7Z64_00110 [Acidiphilium sp. 21-68-69]
MRDAGFTMNTFPGPGPFGGFAAVPRTSGPAPAWATGAATQAMVAASNSFLSIDQSLGMVD